MSADQTEQARPQAGVAAGRGPTAAVVLAAGRGVRFHSELAKVLHPAAGRTLLRWALESLRPLGLDRVVVVVGHQGEAVRAEAEAAGLPGLHTVEQPSPEGTGHAVRVVADAGTLEGIETVLVVPGDAPLLRSELLAELLAAHRGPVTLLSAELDDPTGYGRVLRDGSGAVTGIVEERDADAAARATREVNASVYAFDRAALVRELAGLRSDNAQGEQYLTDVVAPLAAGGGAVAVRADAVSASGVNDRAELARAAGALRARILDGHMRAGVTVVDPAATYVDADVAVAAGAELRPGVHLHGATTVGAGAVVGPDCEVTDSAIAEGATVSYSVLRGASIGPGASVGPYCSLREGTRLGEGAKAGTFVEMKNAVVGPHSKVPHLAYVGDATIGRDVNVGAGTITCNYDGKAKHHTVIGDGAFIGSDTMLIAPVTVGARAVTGAASAISRDVPAGALAVERSEQRHIAGYGDRRAGHRPEPAAAEEDA